MAAFKVDWSELPKELLGSILQRLPIVDNIRFGAVCTSWNSVSSDKSYRPLAPQLPWMMLPYKVGQEGKETRKFLNLAHKKIYQMKLPKEIRHSRCVGSSFGWLVILDAFCCVLLMNPFSGAIIHLPPTETLPDVLGVHVSESSGEIDHYMIRRYGPNRECSISPGRLRVGLMSKAIVTADPLVDSNYMVIAIGFSGLVFCKAGADSWTQLDRTMISSKGSCEDILYFNGLLYVLNAYGDIMVWDLNELPLNKAKEVDPPFGATSLTRPQPYGNWFIWKRYLAESSGDLLQVLLWFRERDGKRNVYTSASCGIYRLDLSTKTWIEVESLGDSVLFLGRNSAISLSTRNFPECRENSIYFAEHFWKGWLEDDPNVDQQNLGFFSLEERRFVKYYYYALKRIKPPLIWVVPNFM
ncbi:F-box protein At2g26160-like [Macadamia integrifolia]|uniref:F-box protein At2g26160-like n=1 Tax=Macadamia integrifolia TaxID=60698 RepID=UPI001C4FC4DB|nr:F-box protein At2g26160-like [Macadamia integrifolia]